MGRAGVSGACVSMALLWLQWNEMFVEVLCLLKEAEKMSSDSGDALLLM